MAEKNRYPQIPSTVWWGVRAALNRSPGATIDERLLGVQLGVQDAAAKAYVNELKSVGLITEEGKATPLALRWRLDDTYADAVTELVENNYPESLTHIAPPGSGERQKVVSWFQREGLGHGAAGNKAATYLLISSPTANEAARTGQKPAATEKPARNRQPRAQREDQERTPAQTQAAEQGGGRSLARSPNNPDDGFPLNVNIQIHISADAGTEQIESIFKAMRRYLYDAPPS